MSNYFNGRLRVRACRSALAAFIVIGAAFAVAAKPTVVVPTRTFTVRVLDATSKQPLPNVVVKFAPDNKMTQAASGDDGRAVLAIPKTAKTIYVALSDPTHVPVTLQWRVEEEAGRDSVDVMLPQAVPINGHVQDDAGEPIAGATVVFEMRINRDATWPHTRVGINYEHVATDANGLWSFDQTPEDISQLTLGVYHPQYVANENNEGYYNFEPVKNAGALRDGSSVLTLKHGVRISGQVVDADGKPVAKASVAVGQDRIASNIVPPVKVDADGKFTVAAMSGKPLVLTATAKGFAPDLQTINVVDSPPEVTLKLGAPRTLSGRVVDSDGKPVRGVGVAVVTWRGARTLNKRMSTNADGKFSWNEAPADAVVIDVFDQAHADQRGISMTAGQENVVKMAAPMAVNGTVIDDETGQPLPAFTIVRGIKFNDNAVRWQRNGYGMADSQGVNGGFKREFNTPYPGNAIRIEASGYLPNESPAWPLAAGQVAYTFRMKHGKDVSGMVTAADGTPAANCDAVLVTAGGSPFIVENGQMSPYTREFIHVTTDAAGKFSFPPQTGEYRVAVFGPAGAANVSAADLNGNVPITLTAWVRIEGVAKIGSHPATDAKIDGNTNRVYEQGWEKKPQVWFQYTATADPDGKFAFERVMPGVPLSISRRLELSNNSYTGTATQTITVKPGEVGHVQLGGVGRPVIGTFKLADAIAGQPWTDYDANLSGRPAQEPPPTPTDYNKWTAAEQRKWFETFRKSPEGVAYFKKVMAPDTRPGKYYATALSQDGTFRIDDVEPGNYELMIQLRKPSPDRMRSFGQQLAEGRTRFIVPTVPGGQSDEPVTVPTITVNPPGALSPATTQP